MHVMGSVSQANASQDLSVQQEDIAIVVTMSTPSPPYNQSRYSDIEDNQMKSPDIPPPPPPPPPPLPPLLPELGHPAGGLKKKRRVRSFFWKTIPEEQVKGRLNLWTQGRVKQKYQIDAQTVEELFGQHDGQSKNLATPARGGKTSSSFRETKQEVSILDAKRGMNIAIFLKQFKRSNETIVDEIRHGNSEAFGVERLRELLKLLPESEEVKKLKAHRGEVSQLSLADSFMYQLIQVPSYTVRIESMLLKEDFPAACEAMKRDIKILRSAIKELMCCEELHAVLHLVLQAGNILNAGGYAGNAVGFKLSSLLSLADTKANKPGMNLLHFVALEAQKKDEKLLEFPLKLSHIQAAARISLETLDAELHLLTSRTHSVEESIQRDTELLQQLDSFLQHATSSLCSLRGSRQQLKREGSELIDFFCEDRDSFRLDDCFSIFHTFCSRFTNAVKENMEREVKEAARRQRIQELEEKKRHSWAGGEKVDGVFGLRCHSELDMSTALSRHDEAGLLMELLTPRSHPRSPVNNSHSPLGRAVSLRRSRKSPSCSPSIAAERELSTFLEKATDRKNIQQRGKGSSFPSPSSPGFPVSTQTAPQNPSSPSKRSPKNKNHATATYLSQNATQTCANATNPANELAVKPTSDSNQPSEHNNNSSDQPGMGLTSHATPTTSKTKDVELVLTQQTDCTDERFQQSTTATGNMVVVLEKCTLVPELKVFDSGDTLTSHSDNRHVGLHQDDVTITDLEEEKGDESQVDKVQNGQLIVNPKQSDEQVGELSSSSTPREDDEGQEDKVVVWCVTGVCEATSDTQSTYAETEKGQHKGDNQGGNKQTSSALANDMPSEPQPANEKPVPVPISSQPVPVSRCEDTSLLVSSSVWRPKEPPSPNIVPALTADASEKDKELNHQEEEAEASTNKNSDGVTVSKESTEEKSKNNMASKDLTSKTAKAASSTKVKAEPATPSKLSNKSLPTSKVQTNGKKPATPNTISASGKSKSIRTLTTSENKDMRRVVPITRTNRSPSRIKHTEKTQAQNRGSSSTAVPTSLIPSRRSSASPRQVARPANAPSSQQSGIPKTLDPKDSKDQNVSGTQPSAREQNKDFQGKLFSQKPLMKPKAQQEEKICRSTLRALSQGGRSGGGGSISAPATPLRKATSSSSSVLPGFARSTASSSFRRTHTNLAVPAASQSPNTGSDPFPKSSPKTPSSVAPSRTSLPITRSRSLRVHASARSSDVQKLSLSSQRKSQSVKSSPRASRHDLLAPPKGHRWNDSDSDKSTHSQDSVLPTRPRWR
ncbi:FH2 domain-containing protein 1-like [Oreochromis aureus]|uniref:FH2 domain-containing protein 1-like n=1 Tax=Oreochromis aureus TaxID=47969 RepID=UPI001952ADE3|nr:FH2 domain-containing protein 1-like [Oreochromis aureus]XP_039466386.1 FH2 domain-containing protein 1-like [Oreochromis aureus]